MSRAVMQQALEALEEPDGLDEYNRSISDIAIAALRQALAEPEQKPVALFDESLGRPVLLSGAPMLYDKQPLYTAPTPRMPLRESDARMMASLMDEAAANLAALMETPQADALGVRHFLPDELNGCAIMLYGNGDKYAATRRAIVRAAAEIGKEMK